MKHHLITLALLLTAALATAADKTFTVTSPDGHLSATVAPSPLSYTVAVDGKTVVTPSPIALELTDGTVIATVKGGAKYKSVKETVDAPFYRQSQVNCDHNAMTLRLNDGFSVEFRAYNDGIAYRFSYTGKKPFEIRNEVALVSFAGDPNAWIPYSNGTDATPFACSFENTYTEGPLSAITSKPAFLPATVDCGEAKVTLLESDLEVYPGMMINTVKTDDGYALKAVFAPYPKTIDYHPWRHMTYVTEGEDFIAKVSGARNFPWRLLAVTVADTRMPVNNLVYATATPNRIGDISWLKPGKVAWDWWNDWNLKGVNFKAGINMDTYKYYIDFAAANGIEYVVLDEGWYNTASGDILDIVPAINLPELIRYGKQKGVGIVLWMVFNCVDENLEAICKTYSEMGAKGFKIDFLDRNDQTAVEMAYRITECAARYHIFVDYHGFWKPTGMSRTYPNILNYEGVYGLEQCKWQDENVDHPRYDVTIPFIRMMAGYMDYTPGAMRNRAKGYWYHNDTYPASMGTRCHQAAMYVVYDAPFEMLCDAPTMYQAEPEYTKFIASIPTVFDQTIVPSAKLGEYIVMARRSGDDWYIAGMTNWTARKVVIDLGFLPKGNYELQYLIDGINADHNAEDYMMGKLQGNTQSINGPIEVPMGPGGGFVAKLIKK